MSTESKMTHHPAHHESQPGATQQPDEPDFWRSRYALGLVVIGAAALYFLLTEHRDHFFRETLHNLQNSMHKPHTGLQLLDNR